MALILVSRRVESHAKMCSVFLDFSRMRVIPLDFHPSLLFLSLLLRIIVLLDSTTRMQDSFFHLMARGIACVSTGGFLVMPASLHHVLIAFSGDH